jgi:hypothetical protein
LKNEVRPNCKRALGICYSTMIVNNKGKIKPVLYIVTESPRWDRRISTKLFFFFMLTEHPRKKEQISVLLSILLCREKRLPCLGKLSQIWLQAKYEGKFRLLTIHRNQAIFLQI